MPKTLYDKLWNMHLIHQEEDGNALIYIDRHLVHEVTSPQAFEGLRENNRDLWRKNSILSVPDHNVPTINHELGIDGIKDEISRTQVATLHENALKYDLQYIPLNDIRQGIVHVIGPEQGATLPGMTIVCGDSHTSTHGAFGCLAMGIGTSEVEHVMATQSLWQKKAKNMLVKIDGNLVKGVYSKDLILAIIGKIGTAGGTGYAIEFAGSAIENMTMEARMTVCNMTIEAGAKTGMIAVDQTTLDYLKGRPYAPQGELWEKAMSYWLELKTDAGANFDKIINLNAEELAPQTTWGTSPEMVASIDGKVPNPSDFENVAQNESVLKALEYMGLVANQHMQDIELDYIFIGSCTNSRIEDLRTAAKLVEDKKVASNIQRAMVVPGSGLIKEQAEKEGLDKIFTQAGFEWREAGCSMCLGMNEDLLPAKKRCASTSNRNFEGRQGYLGRTHLVSPATAAVSALSGRLADVREYI